jgi:hypothetical protein
MSHRPVCSLLLIAALTTSASAQPPNFRLAISNEFANLAARQPLDRCDKLDEVILGTRLRGLGRSVGEVRFEFVPSETAAVIDLVMTATTTDLVNSTGTNGPVTVISQATAQVGARKRIFLTPDGIATLPAIADAQPTAALVRIDTQLHGVLDKVVKRVAYKIYQRDEDKGIALGRALAIRKLTKGFDEDLAPRVEKANYQFIHELREPLRQRGLYPQSVHLQTDAGYLHIMGSLLVAPLEPPVLEAPPEFPPGTQLAGWLHESLPNSFLTRIFSGKRFTSEELTKEISRLLGDRVPAGPPGESFAIEFAEVLPISLAFRDGSVTMTIRSVGFSAGGEDYNDPNLHRMNTTVKYRLSVRDSVLVGQRVELEVLPSNYQEGKPLGARQQFLRRLMLKQLEPQFPRNFQTDTTTQTPATFTQAGKLGLERVVSERGWLAGSLRWIPPIVE